MPAGGRSISSVLSMQRFIGCALTCRRLSIAIHLQSCRLVSRVLLRCDRYAMSGFLGAGAPVFEIRESGGDATDLLVRNNALGAALARSLGDASFVLMRGHGSTVVAPTLKQAVYRAVYAEVNARMQIEALNLGDVVYLSEEAATACANIETQVDRPWELWKKRVQRLHASDVH